MKNYSNPYQAPEVDNVKNLPSDGMRGLYPTNEGWVDIDSAGEKRKIATDEDVSKSEKDIYDNVYTKTATDSRLDRKADSDEIIDMCKYKGVVSSFNDLPYEVAFEVSGEPYIVIDGVQQKIGEFSTETKIVTFDNYQLPQGDGIIKIPVASKTLEAGYYACGRIDFGAISGLNESDDGDVYIDHYIGDISCGHPVAYYSPEQEILEIDILYGNESDAPVIINGSSEITCCVSKVVYLGDLRFHESLDVGHIYKATDNNSYYIWTGTEWDTLGASCEGGDGSGIDTSHRQDKNNPHDVTASQVGAYTKAEVDSRLSSKANKSDITNVYKFFGSVDTFDDLPFKYDLIPNGVPTHDGEVCGTYDEETHTVTIDDVLLEEVDSDRIIIPIVPIDVAAGKYFTDGVYYGGAYIGNLCTYACSSNMFYETLSECVIDHIEIFTPHGEETISGTTNNLGYLPRIIDSWISEYGYVYIPSGAFDNGVVYNVLDTGMNYAWNGTEWDALGGEHKDIEAREDIAAVRADTDALITNTETHDSQIFGLENSVTQLEAQMGDVETALDSIIEIQNSLIGGDSV